MLSAFGQYACGVFFDYLIKGIGQQFYKKPNKGGGEDMEFPGILAK